MRFVSIRYEGRQYRAYLTETGSIGRISTISVCAGKPYERDLNVVGTRRQALVALAEEKARR